MPNNSQTLSVALVDSHPMVRAGLRTLLEAEQGLRLEAEGSCLEEIADRLETTDVVLLELQPAGLEGLAGLRRLRELHPEVAPVVFTLSDSEACLVEALLAGAHSYLLKSCYQSDIASALRAAGRGHNSCVPREMLANALRSTPWVTSSGNGSAPRGSRLTPREAEVLSHMATGAPYQAIAVELDLAESTIKKYAHRIIGKLGATCRATAVIVAHRHNLLKEIAISS